MRFLSVFLILFLSACGPSSTDGARSTNQSGDAALAFKYHCESGKTIIVSYPTENTAIVTYGNRQLNMKVAVSGSGARYVGEGLEWWSKGSGEGAPGTLFRHMEDGTTGDAIERCEEVADTAGGGRFSATRSAPKQLLNAGVTHYWRGIRHVLVRLGGHRRSAPPLIPSAR